MIRTVMLAVLGIVLTGIGILTVWVLGGGFSIAAMGRVGALLLVPAAFVIAGIVLLVAAAQSLRRERQRARMPLAQVRAEPVPAGAGHWALADVAGGIARRLQGRPCTVHHADDRIEIRWPASSQRCELQGRAGVLSHTEVLARPLDHYRLHRGVITHVGQSTVRAGVPLTQAAFATDEAAAAHAALEETLRLAGWRYEG